jgi:RNA polymerase sigma factor (sigma-70 family)
VQPLLRPPESFATVRRQTSPFGADHAERANVEARQARRRRARSARLDASPLQDPFKAYMEEISRSDLLDYTSVLALASSIKAGAAVETAQRELEDRAGDKPTLGQLAAHLDMTSAEVQRTLYAGTVAKNDLVAANLRLVSSIARKIEMTKTSTAGIALDDMIQEGNVGLIRAAEKYDASRGYRFSTYATWWIRASVLRAITNQSRPIKVPSSIVEDYQRIRKERDRQVAAGMGRSDDKQVAEALGMTPAKVRFVVSVVTGSVSSLDIALGRYSSDGSSRTLLEVLPGDDNVEERMVESMQRAELDKVLRFCLKPTERAAIRLRFGLDDGHARTLREVGELLSVSKERVRQLVFTALSKLKTPEVHTALVDYLS